ncbi:MAG: hypothetical protein ABFS14_12305 [Gemmatimonadota bacterium]
MQLTDAGLVFEYEYSVEGGSLLLQDVWTRVSEDLYEFRVREIGDDGVITTHLETTFERVDELRSAGE